MDLRINRAELVKALYLANGIADRKSTLPMLSTVLLRTDGKDKVIVAATDLSVTVVATIAAKVEKEGGLALGARQAYDIVKGLNSDEVELRRTDQNWAELRGGRAEFKLVGMSDRDFPKLPAVAEVQTQAVDPAILRDMIAKTIFSVSSDETRQHLAGVLFESDGQTARMVSTDGHRLSKVERALPNGPVLANGVLVPRKGVFEVRRLIEAREQPCDVGVRDGQLLIRADNIAVSVKLSDSQFPPYEQVIPKDNERRVVVGREALLEALRRVALMASDKTWGIRLGLEKGKLSVEADSPELGNARERLDVDYKGEPFQAGFNARYYIELLTEIGASDVEIALSGELDPAVITGQDANDYVGVIMPMRL